MMKNNACRIGCALLAGLMLLGTFASCAETKDPVETDPVTGAATEAGTADGAADDTTSADSDAGAADSETTDADLSDSETEGQTAVETEEPQLKDCIPEGTNFDDEEIVIYSRYREGWTSGEISVEKLNTDLINDTVYERNKEIEARLGVRINSVLENEHDPTIITNKLNTSVTSGSHEYDLFACACYTTINQSLSGTFVDLRSTEYFDYEKPWWSQGFNEAVEYRDTQFVATGSALISMYRFAFVTVFNKDMFKDNNVPLLYDDVKNRKWTLDRQIELVTKFHIDGGAKGEQDEEGDVYGLVTNDYISVDPYWSSCDVKILGRDENGSYALVFDTDKMHSVADKVLKLFYETSDSVYNYKHEGLDDEQVYIRDMFANNGAAMATLRILELESGSIRNMKEEYGVIPMPKFDEMQKDYKTLVHDQVTVLTIPTSIIRKDGRMDMASAVMEAMASSSHYTLRPAYYETTLRTKIAKDPESAEMMDTIINNIYIDAGILYTSALNSFHDKFRQIMGSKNNTVASDYKTLCKQLNKRGLGKMLDKLDALAEKENE